MSASPLTPELRLCTRLFWGWLTFRTLLWTVVASLVQPNAPLDLIEWLAWGHEWRWGYPKHPPLPGWIAEVFAHLSPGGVWGVYLAAYLCVAVCLWSVWRLGRELLSPRLALIGVLCLEGLIYFHYDAAEFSNNVVLNACWAVAILCLAQALRTTRMTWWVGLGFAAGLGLLSKYSIAFLFAPMALYVVTDREARQCLRRPGPYVAALVALALFAPHVLWMIDTDFMTVRYGVERAADTGSWFAHFKNPIGFCLSQLARNLPILLVLVPLTSWRWRLQALTPEQRRWRNYLAFVVLGPLVLLLSQSFLTGSQVREIWGSPLWTFLGLFLLVALRLETTGPALVRARWVCAAMVLLAVAHAFGKTAVGPLFTRHPARVHFPGRELAGEVTRRWNEQCAQPFGVVGGECWLAGNIGCYAPHRPSLYSNGAVDFLSMDARVTPWTSDDDLRARGGVLVWQADRAGDDLPAELRTRFPTARVQPPVVLRYRTWADVPPARVGVAFVAPAPSKL